jgi:hypothetical protein
MNNNTNKKKRLSKRVVITAIAALLVIGIALPLILLLWNDGDDFDFLKSDLSENIEISESDYKGYSISLKYDGRAEKAAERSINALLYLKKASSPDNYGAELKDVPITLGDKAYIYYTVKVLDENGREVVSSQKALTDATGYGVGSYLFMPKENVDRSLDYTTPYATDIDDALVGVLPADHKFGAVITEGSVLSGDRIIFSYTKDGVTRCFMTTLSECDAIYGEGMAEFLSGAPIGVRKDELVCELSGASRIYNNIRIEYAVRAECAPLSVSFSFPDNYGDKELRGKRAVAEIWFRGSVAYKTPEYNEEFITKTLGVSEETLLKYEGADTVERHKNMILAECEADTDRVRECLREEAVWDYLVSRAEVKELPRDALEEAYNAIYSARYIEYNNFYSIYFPSSPESYIAWLYGLSNPAYVPSFVYSLAEREVTERLIFYHIARETDVLPKGEKLDAAYNGAVDEEFAEYVKDYEGELSTLSPEEKEKKLSTLRLKMIEDYGEEYFTETAYYNTVFPVILGYGTVTYN